jgi:flagellar biosynthetic protein FliO
MIANVLSLLARRALFGATFLFFIAFLTPTGANAEPDSKPATTTAPQPADQTPAPPIQVQPAQPTEPSAPVTDFPVLRTIGGFALVISLILIAFLAARKIAPQYFSKRASENSLKMIETISMGEKRSIAIIQVGDKRLLLGNTPHQITVLTSLEDSVPLLAAADQDADATSPHKTVNPFRRLYERERNRGVDKSGKGKSLPPDVRAKMRQLRASLEG